MCNFFSFVTEPENHGGKKFYFNKKQRSDSSFLSQNNLGSYDSHSSICKYFGLREEICNRYEWDIFDEYLEIDTRGSEIDDYISVNNWIGNFNINKEVVSLPRWLLPEEVNIGDTLIFRPLKEIRIFANTGCLPCGWNRDMDYLSIKQVKIKVNSIIKCKIDNGSRTIARKGDGFSISLPMLRKARWWERLFV